MPDEMSLARLTRMPHESAGPLKALLEGEGIEVMLLGEHRAGLAGAIPVQETWAELCVPKHQLEAAQAVLERARSAAEGTGARRCPRCTETSPADWAECWSCGADLSQQPLLDDDDLDHPPSSAAGDFSQGSVGASPAPPSLLANPWVLLVVVAAAVFFAFQWLSTRAELEQLREELGPAQKLSLADRSAPAT